MTEARRARCAAIDLLHKAARDCRGDKNTAEARRKHRIPLDLVPVPLWSCLRVDVLCDILYFGLGWSQPIHCIIVCHLIRHFFLD
jgi:hypothetical protein